MGEGHFILRKKSFGSDPAREAEGAVVSDKTAVYVVFVAVGVVIIFPVVINQICHAACDAYRERTRVIYARLLRYEPGYTISK